MSISPSPGQHKHEWAVALVVALIGAAATIAAGVIGARGGLNTIVPGAQGPTTATSTITVTATVTAAEGNGSTPSPTGADGIYHQGEIRWVDGSASADLDGDPTDNSWGQRGLAPNAKADLHVSVGMSPVVWTENEATAVQVGQTADDLTCKSASGFASNRIGIDTGPVLLGQYICFQTDQKRLALVKITKITEKEVDIYVKSYNP